MKNIKQNLLIGIVLLTILISCSNSGGGPDVYYGIWENSKQKITITKGWKANYDVKINILKNGDEIGYDYFTYQDGKLGINGSTIISYSDGKIIYKGDEYDKIK